MGTCSTRSKKLACFFSISCISQIMYEIAKNDVFGYLYSFYVMLFYCPSPLYAINFVVAVFAPVTLAPVVPARALIRATTAAGVVIDSRDMR